MLFNSYEFLFFFLPTTFVVFFALSGLRWARAAAAWLALASIFFYGYWNPRFVVLLLLSIALNFLAGRAMLHARAAQRWNLSKYVLALALVGNLATLGYFKYANFFVSSINSVAGTQYFLAQIALPIGISFFTFTQIAFLLDTYHGKVAETRVVPYVLFVTFFPHLIAGPVLHHAEMMPQFARQETYRFRLDNFFLGVGFLVIGLFKKVILADGIQPFVSPVFEADPTYTLTMLEAWGGVLAYTLQLYFDFSGYSDMAIGLAKMVNVDLPLNFNSPYKAANISDFWRRWHMTLSRFLRDYLYVPLGGNRRGRFRRYANLLITMVLGGLWHGAGWTFVVWGTLHGVYLVVHHGWQALHARILGPAPSAPSRMTRIVATLLTFLSVVVAWVFFRATSIDVALRVLHAMAGQHGFVLPIEWQSSSAVAVLSHGLDLRFLPLDAWGGGRQLTWLAILLAMVWLLPNSQTLLGNLATFRLPTLRERWAWMSLGALSVVIFTLAAINGSRGSSEFIYFNF
jgi:alginate O-acetyltransferase complex protein AlgI